MTSAPPQQQRQPLTMRGMPPPQPMMSHTLPMTNRSYYGGGQKRPGARSAFGGSVSTSSFFTRHNPHPGRVRHIEGLLGVPICHVSDDVGRQPARQQLLTPERRSIRLAAYQMPSSEYPIYPTNAYSVADRHLIREKAVPYQKAPVLPRWFEELKDIGNRAGLQPGVAVDQQVPKTGASYSKTTGRLNEAPSRAMTRTSRGKQPSRSGQFTGAINKAPDNEALVMELLSQILQTDSISTIQQWLTGASEREKDLVSDMIRAAMATESQLEYQQQQPEEPAGQIGADGAQFDRLVVDDTQQTTRLPDINSGRSWTIDMTQNQRQPTINEDEARENISPINGYHSQIVEEIMKKFVEYRTLEEGQKNQ